MPVVQIHIPQTSPRIHYVAQFLFEQVLKLEYVLVEDAAAGELFFSDSSGQKKIAFRTSGIFSETGITASRKEEALQALVQYRDDGLLPETFPDLVFFLLSRYEEYLPFEPDRHGRFPATESVLLQSGLLHIPVIEEWIKQLRAWLDQELDMILPAPSAFSFLPTYDIDITHAFFHRPWWRTAGAVVKEMLTDRSLLALRYKVLRKQVTDPFDAFADMDTWHDQYGLNPLYFWLLADYGPYDKNISPNEPVMRQLVGQTTAQYPTGIHPSYRSNEFKEALQQELERFRAITGRRPLISRQHYIRCHLPQTYRQLLTTGITDDYSMGYGTHNGFRAGVSRAFYWYDLRAEVQTSLLVHPFVFMEATSLFQLKQSPNEAFEELVRLTERVRWVGGTMITIFHNYTLGQNNPYKGWRQMYLRYLQKIKAPAV